MADVDCGAIRTVVTAGEVTLELEDIAGRTAGARLFPDQARWLAGRLVNDAAAADAMAEREERRVPRA